MRSNDQCKNKYILRTDRRPTTDRPLIWPILGNFKWPYLREDSSMFGSTLGFSGLANRMALIPV